MQIEREIVLPIPREEAWEALTEPERLEEWFANDVELDAVPGGEGVFEWDNGEVRHAIVESVEATHDNGGEDQRFTARIHAPSPEAALGSILTVLDQTSGHLGLAEEGSLRLVVIEREEPPREPNG